MSIDRDRNDSEKPVTEQEGVMFAAQPIWERRGRKRGGFGRKAAPAAAAPTVSPEPRSFAAERDYEEPMALDTPVDNPLDRPMADRPMDRDYVRAEYAPAAVPAAASTLPEEADSGMVAPIGRASTRAGADRAPKSKGIGPAAMAAAVVTVGALGAVGWYATRDNDGIPEIAPGSPTTSEIAAAPLPPVDMPPSPQVADTSVNPPNAVAPPRQTVRATAPVRTAQATRTRPAAAAPSAADTGVNTSAAIPAGPQPYSTLNPGATTPAPVNPVVTPTPPTQAAPPPTETPAPAPTQATPPTEPEPETTVTPPTS
jgi:hypothetical protein